MENINLKFIDIVFPNKYTKHFLEKFNKNGFRQINIKFSYRKNSPNFFKAIQFFFIFSFNLIKFELIKIN